MTMIRLLRSSVAGAALVVLGGAWAASSAQWAPTAADAENPAIAYTATAPSDPVARLQRALDAGEAALRFDEAHGYLESVLRALQVPAASQALVFSKTSFQRGLISPAHPRALYFARDVYVGWVPGAPQLEVVAIDAALGPIFYTLDQRDVPAPRFERQTRACLVCHDSLSSTGGVPGLLVKSVRTDQSGEPIPLAPSHVTTDRSPIAERWGGWYVTGAGGEHRHLGAAPGAAVDLTPYLQSRSDLAAQTLLAHQATVQNLLTRLSYRTRMALSFDRQRNRDLGLRLDAVSDATQGIIAREGEPLVRALLGVDEAPLGGPLEADGEVVTALARQAPRDPRGRSLADLDLQRRLLRYPCSYLIYSPAFDALPEPAKAFIYRRLGEVLDGRDTRPAFAHLSSGDRRAVLEILRETKPEFIAYAP